MIVELPEVLFIDELFVCSKKLYVSMNSLEKPSIHNT